MAKLTDAQREHMLTLRNAKIGPHKIAEIIGCSASSVVALFTIYDSLRDGKSLKENYTNTQQAHIRFVKSKLGIEDEKTPEHDNTALAIVTLLESITTLTKAVDAIDQRLSAMQMSIAGARDDSNQNAKKLVETINVNGDIQTKEWQSIKDKLEAIKINTKRRPWKEDNP